MTQTIGGAVASASGQNGGQHMTESFEVSPQQEALWSAEPGGPSGRVQAVLAISGTFDQDRLQRALDRAVERHESLRTTFKRETGLRIPLQTVQAAAGVTLRSIDLDPAAAGEQSVALEQVLDDERCAPLDFERGPLLRAVVVSLGADSRRLVLTAPAVCADAGSLAILASELAGGAGHAAEAAEPLQYADFSAWQRETLASDSAEAQAARSFWDETAELRSPLLPFSAPHEQPEPFTATAIRLHPQPGLSVAVEQTAARYGATAGILVEAVWRAVLRRFSGDAEVAVGLCATQRRHGDLEGAIGLFCSPVPLVTEVTEETTVAELVHTLARLRGDALVWQDYAPVTPPSDVRVGFADCGGEAAPQGADIRLERITAAVPGCELWCSAHATRDSLDLSLWFDPTRHGVDSISRLGRALELSLAAASARPQMTIGELPLLGDSERELVLFKFNDTARPVPSVTLHELIASRAPASGEQSAVIDRNGPMSWATLERRSNQLAHRLRASGVGPDVTVGLLTERSAAMVVGLLGILKAGGAYVPLHHEHPAARLADQLATADARVIVTESAVDDRLGEVAIERICLDDPESGLDTLPGDALDGDARPENLAYVTFTSGSTGRPKGVCVTHANVVNYASDIVARLGADAESLSFGMVTSVSTDLGNTCLFGALCSGGTLVLVSPEAAGDPGAFGRIAEASPIDVLKITPSHLSALIAGGERRVLPRRMVVLGGERAPWDLIERIRSLSDCAILNHYGPTETTVGSCTFPVSDGPDASRPASVPIGSPISNTRCYVLDERAQPAPIGVAGALMIGGAGVAQGYAGSPDLTGERFLADPFIDGARVYDTGDRARWLPDGTLEFLGRTDEQVKIRGYRVEPGEVDEALRRHQSVRDAITVARVSGAGGVRLFSFCTTNESAFDRAAVEQHLTEWLPEFMLPSAIIVLEDLPRTPSGKIDVLGLPDPELATGDQVDGARDGYVAPRTPIEEAVVAIWEQVLGKPQVGINDDFFALGGHSLLATQVVAQVRSDFAVDLPLHSLFTSPTVALLTEEIVQMISQDDDDETARLMAELESMSDEEAQRLLRDDSATSGSHGA